MLRAGSREATLSCAFSLIELVIVIGLIAAFFGLVGLTFSDHDGRQGVRAGQRISAGVMQSSRALALLKSTRVRCIINNELGDAEKYRRYLGIVYFDTNENLWHAAGKGEYLPPDVFYLGDEIEKPGSSVGTASSAMGIEFPRAEGQIGDAAGRGWIYYENNEFGETRQPGRRFYLSTGEISDSDGFIDFDPSLVKGFVVYRLGSIAMLD